jgi:UDP-glucose 4-epimerase
MTTWVIGQGGLLGSALVRHIDHPSSDLFDDLFVSQPIPWSDPVSAAACLANEYQRFREQSDGRPWRILWAAGAATVSTPREPAQAELGPFQALLSQISAHPPQGPGVFFVTSSAGGVFAGSAGAPFNAESTPVPLSPYGDLKIAQEALAAEQLAEVCPVVIGRFSNLYGPGQNLGKLQGLISRLALAGISQQPVSIFVPLDTIRDYIYVDDAAMAALNLADLALADRSPGARTAIIASGQPATVGQVIHTMGQVARRRIPVAYGTHPSASAQALDLRLTPSAGVDCPTHLPAGMKAAYQDILARVQASQVGGYQASPASAG